MEGVCENVIFGGSLDGNIFVFSAWDLKQLYVLNNKEKSHLGAVTAMAIR